MAAHCGLGWRDASWVPRWPQLRRWQRRVRSRQAALEQVARLPCQLQGLCELRETCKHHKRCARSESPPAGASTPPGRKGALGGVAPAARERASTGARTGGRGAQAPRLPTAGGAHRPRPHQPGCKLARFLPRLAFLLLACSQSSCFHFPIVR